MKHTISVLVRNSPGVLAKISGLFSRRGYNIESLAVGPTEVEGVSRMTIILEGNEQVLEQIKKQLNKLIDTIKVVDLDTNNSVSREMALIKVGVASTQQRSEVIQIVDVFRAKILDITDQVVTVEITGRHEKVDAMIELLSSFGIKEVARTGNVALSRGGKVVSLPKLAKQ
ncbi:MAG: acetolactate synthase small subunit [Candidatus Methanofastidiosa archaeon]|jgi:acetolactate synthase-1/3 small subunit|nr:acetolactate synthase small subunit [Candidatus Methanofastidiosa archaeon]MDD4281417.1 acetolactate synthase small subunit [Candidatus Methanofastidiosa archaeon]